MKLKKHLGLLAAVVIVSSGANSVVACGATQQEASKPIVLFSELKQTNLGYFLSSPSEQELLGRVAKLNPIIDLNSLEVVNHDPFEHQAIVRSLDFGKYVPNARIALTYHLGVPPKQPQKHPKQPQNLPDLFKTTHLGTFGAWAISPYDVEVRLKADHETILNDGVTLDFKQLDISSIEAEDGKRSFVLKPKDYCVDYVRSSSVILTFLQDPVDVAFHLDLDLFDDFPSEAEVLARFEYWNHIPKNQFVVKPGSLSRDGHVTFVLNLNDHDGTANRFYDCEGFQGVEAHYRLTHWKHIEQTHLGPIPKDKVTFDQRRNFLFERIKALNPKLNLVEDQYEIIFDYTKDYGPIELKPKPNSLYEQAMYFYYQLDLSTIVLPEADLVFDHMIIDKPYTNFRFDLFDRLKKIDSSLDFLRLDLWYDHDFTKGYECLVPHLKAKSDYDYQFCGELVIDNYKINLQKVFARGDRYLGSCLNILCQDDMVMGEPEIKQEAKNRINWLTRQDCNYQEIEDLEIDWKHHLLKIIPKANSHYLKAKLKLNLTRYHKDEVTHGVEIIEKSHWTLEESEDGIDFF